MATLWTPPLTINQLAWQFAEKANAEGWTVQIDLTRNSASHHIQSAPTLPQSQRLRVTTGEKKS